MATSIAATARPARHDAPVDLAAEVALAFTTVAAVACLGRLFADRSWFVPVLTAAVAAHLLAAVLRRVTSRAIVAWLVAVAGALVFVGWTRYPGSTTAGLPTPDTVAAVRTDLAEAWRAFGRVVAPAPAEAGFVLACVLAVWAMAWFADTAAFRLRAPVEAVLPAVAMLLFTAMLGAADGRTSAAVALTAAILVFLLLHRVAGQVRGVSWVGTGAGAGVGRLVGVGLAVAASAVVVGAIAGPTLPGSGSNPLVDWRGDGAGRGTRVTVSPLVDIRRRLVQQSDLVAFTVRADKPSYWRLTSLDDFDGQVWSSSGRYSEAGDDLDSQVDEAFTEPVAQHFEIRALNAIWAPAALQATGIDDASADLRWDGASATLIVDTDVDDSDSISYDVESEVPVITRDQAERARAPVPAEIIDTYLELPDDFEPFRPDVDIIIGDAETPYEKAKTLQDHFRDNFTYNLEGVAEGHSESAMAAFLRDREGYCEQFAGTFAAFARQAGIPARVAVGFTTGEPVASDPSLYTVRGKNAHAWPEVYLGGIGWVPFEPTPGRGFPGGEDYTGVEAAQEGDGADGESAAPPTTAPATTAPTGPTTLPGAAPRTDALDTAAPSSAARASGPSWIRAPLMLLAVLAGAALAYVAVVRLVVATRRVRRRSRATTSAGRVRLAWEEGSAAVAALGPEPRASETHAEFASRANEKAGAAAPDLRELAAVAAVSAWSPREPEPAEAERAERLSASVRTAVRARLDRRARLRADLHPSLLVGGARDDARPPPDQPSRLKRSFTR